MSQAGTAVCCAIAIATIASSGCAQKFSAQYVQVPETPSAAALRTLGSPIRHVVLIVQENRTYNDFFAGYPGGDGTKVGKIAANAACHIAKDQAIPLTQIALSAQRDLDHSYQGYVTARNGGAMNGFDRVPFFNNVPECRSAYHYTDPRQIEPYWEMAKEYVLADHMLTTQGSTSFIAHQDLIRGDTVVAPNQALVNNPGCAGGTCIWGCDAAKGVRTSLITKNDVLELGRGPFPCLAYPTLRDRLDERDVAWRYYVPKMCCTNFGRLLNAFDAIKAVRYGPQWSDGHISRPQTNILYDIAKRRLPAVSWVIPDKPESDHPGIQRDRGPSWVASIVNAIGESPYWKTTAIVIVWDDWGGLYDNLDPPQLGYGGLGFRVPALIVSAYARKGYVSKTQYEFGSILKYIERNWNLPSLHTSDERANSIIDAFDYSQPPRQFKLIPAKYQSSYFLHERPSNLAVDTDM